MTKLGKTVRDSVTGFEGVATHFHQAWRGPSWYTVVSKTLHEGKIVEEAIDDWRLEVVESQ